MEENILVIDIGNTNTVVGIYTNTELLRTWRILSDKTKTVDDYYSLFINFLSNYQIDYISIASVVPIIGANIEGMIKKYFNIPYNFVNGNTELGLKYSVEDPSFIGADLIANAFAAWQIYKKNCIIFDFGTATTIQLVGQDGFYYGVSILPGLMTAVDSLIKNAAMLKDVSLETFNNQSKYIPSLGSNTKDSILSGIILSHIYTIEGFEKRIKEDYSELSDIEIIATGGLAQVVIEQLTLPLKQAIHLDKNLTLEGLFLISKKLLVTKNKNSVI